jgi:DNA polymerase IV
VDLVNAKTPHGVQPSVMHVRCPDRLPEETYRQVLELLASLSPVVQALPPSAALVELKG